MVTKAKNDKPVYPERPKVVVKGFVINYKACMPGGKYKDRSWQWVLDNDHNYAEWVQKENLLYSWGILVSPEELKPQKQAKIGYSDRLETSTGIWIGLVLVEEKTLESPFL